MVLLITLAGLSLALGMAFLAEIMAAASRITAQVAVADAGEKVVAEAPDPPPPLEVPEVETPQPPPPVPPITEPAIPAPPIPEPLAILPGAASMESAALGRAAGKLADWTMAVQRVAGVNRLAVTSLGGGPGDSSIAVVALARALERSGRVIVADLAPGGSWLERLTGLPPGPGIADLVTGRATFTKVIGRDSASAVHLLRFGIDRSAATLALLDERIEAVLGALAQSYELVIVHAGEATPETPALVHKCQAALLLAPAARAAEAAAAVDALLGAGLTVAGHVVIGEPADAERADTALVANA
jgi:Mrp family chromosome partitioning ATPase